MWWSASASSKTHTTAPHQPEASPSQPRQGPLASVLSAVLGRGKLNSEQKDEAGVGKQLKALMKKAAQKLSSTPYETYNAEKGLHLHSETPAAASVTSSGKLVTMARNEWITVVTSEVVTGGGVSFTFVVGFVEHSISFGVVPAELSGGWSLELPPTSIVQDGGSILLVEQGHRKVVEVPRIEAGSVVSVEVSESGSIYFTVDGTTVPTRHGWMGGGLRFAVALFADGDHVLVVRNDPPLEVLPVGGVGAPEVLSDGSDGSLVPGARVRMPPLSDRVKEMRKRFVFDMFPLCGTVGTVEELQLEGVRVRFADVGVFSLDYGIIPADMERHCLRGCVLKEMTALKASMSCDSCLTPLPRGSSAACCTQHLFRLCRYCQGRPERVTVGMRVVRGPTWRWGDEDGVPYTVGVVTGVDNELVRVDWGHGEGSYRRAPFQDVMPVYDGGIVPDMLREQIKDMEWRARAACIRQVDELAEAQRYQLEHPLPTATYTAEEGHHFTDTLSCVTVTEGGKMAERTAEGTGNLICREVHSVGERLSCSFRMETSHDCVFGVVCDRHAGLSQTAVLGDLPGICILKRVGGRAVVQIHGGESEVETCGELVEGDVLTVTVDQDGAVLFAVNGTVVCCPYRLIAQYRFAASLCTVGAKMRLVVPDSLGFESRQRLSIGTIVTVPELTDRMREQRSRFSPTMREDCGRRARVVSLKREFVLLGLVGTDRVSAYDYDLFPQQLERVCPKQLCTLTEVVADGHHSCDSCLTQVPKGARLAGCMEHSFFLCQFCCGEPWVIAKGMEVVRGPTWKWGEQDGKAYNVGRVTGAVADGWAMVCWGHGKTNRYRVGGFQDIMPACSGGIEVDEKLVACKVHRYERKRRQLIPSRKYDERKGYHLANVIPTISVTEEGTRAESIVDEGGTLVTEEVHHGGPARITFVIDRIAGTVGFGVVTDPTPRWLVGNQIGEQDSLESVGILVRSRGGRPFMAFDGCTRELEGLVLNEGSVVAVEVRGGGSLRFVIDGTVVETEYTVNGGFCFGASTIGKGTRVSLMR